MVVESKSPRRGVECGIVKGMQVRTGPENVVQGAKTHAFVVECGLNHRVQSFRKMGKVSRVRPRAEGAMRAILSVPARVEIACENAGASGA